MPKKPAPAKKQPASAAKKELAKADTGRELAKSNVVDLEADAGVGQETMDRNDYAIPRLTILQDLSPQVKKTEQGYIKGAETGNICDILNELLFDGESGIIVVPASYRRAYIEWRPRKDGGGFAGDHGSDGAILDQCKENPETGVRNVLPNGNTIATVGEYFVFLVQKDGSFTPYVLSMAGSQLKKARRWNTMINQLRVPRKEGGTFNPAMFYRSYQLTTVPERNDKGSWFGWKISPGEDTLSLESGEQIYLAARDLRGQVAEGKVTAAAPVGETHSHEGDAAPM